MPGTDIRYSVILSVRNAERTLRPVFDSLFASGLENFEAVVVDDASTDGTAALCEEYGIQPIRLEQNVGPAAGRNLAAQHARGDILIFLDSDIAFEPEVLTKLTERLNAAPEVAGNGALTSPIPLNPGFYPRYFAIQEYLWTRRALLHEDDASNSYISTRCGCLRRKVFEAMGGFNEQYKRPSTEDLEFSSRMGNRYLIRYYEDVLVQHHYPDRLSKIFARYHRNTCEVLQMAPEVRQKASQPYKRDMIARLMLCFTALFVVLSMVEPLLLVFVLVSFLGAAVVQHELLGYCLRHEGLLFTVKSWLVYCILPVPIVTGLFAGLYEKMTSRAVEAA